MLSGTKLLSIINAKMWGIFVCLGLGDGYYRQGVVGDI